MLPGLHEALAGFHHVLHLQVDGRVKRGHDEALFQGQAGSVHELQQDGEAVRVGLSVQANHRWVAFVSVDEDGVKEATEEGERRV